MSIAVTAIVPASDRIAGGVAAIILGSGFVATPTVTIGGTAATSVVFMSATKLTCVIPAHAAGAVNVVVTNPDTTNASLVNGFTFYTPADRDTELVADFGGSTRAVRQDSLSISKQSGGATANFIVDDETVVPFTPVRLGLGSLADADLLFRGKEQGTVQSRQDTDDIPTWTASAVDSTAEFNRYLAWGTYVDVPADVVALDLLSKFAPDFTGAHVVSGLDPITIILQGDLMDTVFNQIATLIGGYYRRDQSYDVHLFITESPALLPDDLDASNTTLLNDPALTFASAVDQIRNRVVGIGASSQAVAPAAVGDVLLNVADSTIFDPAGSVLAGAQIITYTGKGSGFTSNLNSWVQQTSPSTALWDCIAYAPALGLFVALSSASTDYLTSPDGILWTTRTFPHAPSVNGVCWSPDLGLFVAVGAATGPVGFIYTSPDGITWTSRTAASESWLSVCWSADLGLFVAVGTKHTTSSVATSPDGVTWTSRTGAPDTAVWSRVIWARELALFIAYNASTSNAIMTSPDGVTWTQQTGPGSGVALAWSAPLGLLVAVAGTTVYTSSNGVTWTTHTSALPSGTYADCQWLPSGYFLAVCNQTKSVAVSQDGVTWSLYTPPIASINWLAIAYATDTGRIVVVGENSGLTTGEIMTSDAASVFGTLTGCSGIVTAINAGDPISLYAVRNNTVSQGLIAAIERGTSTGVYEFKITDTTIQSQAALDARCDADLELYADAGGILKVGFTSLDRKIDYGLPLHVDLPWRTVDGILFDPAVFDTAVFVTDYTRTDNLTGDFIIDSVQIANVDEDGNVTPPRYTTTASSVRLSLTVEDLLRHATVAQ